jgi:O-antigen ligase
MNTSEHILSDQVVLSPGQVSPRVLTLPRPEHELSTALWTCERAILLGMLMVVPLLFGAVQPWAWGSITLVATALLLVWAVGRVQRGSVRVLWSPLLLPIAAALILAAVQTFGGLSHDHVATREAFIKLLTYGLIFFVAQQLYVSASAKAWRNSGIAISAYMFAMAAFGMAQYFASPGLLYGYLPESNSVFGPYVNHGNYAGLMEMLIPIASTFAISLRWKHPAKPFALFLAFIAVVSVFLSGSRAGLVSLAAEFVLVAAVLISTRSNQKHLVLVGMAAACLAVGVFYWLDPGETWGRWQQMASRPELALGNRQTIAFDTLRMTRDHLAHGVGLGAFQTAYTPYQTVATDLTIDYAHNDYLQFIAETGSWGIVLLPVSLGMFFLLAFRHLHQRIHQPQGWLQFGAAVGVCGLLVHSFSEFNLHIPANAAWFTFLAAFASLPISHARQTRRNHGHS